MRSEACCIQLAQVVGPLADRLVEEYAAMNSWSFETDSAVIVYQMGKVGSTTVYESLASAGLSIPIYRVHSLSEEGLKRGIEFHHQVLKKPWSTHEKLSRLLREKIDSGQDVQWKIITLVREPIGREISEFFHYVDSLYPDLLDENGNLEKERVVRALRAKFLFYDEATNYACRWFDVEINQVFNLDVYAYPFNHRDGFTVIGRENVAVLILRLEDLDRCFNRGLTELLGLEYPIKMTRSNLRTGREHGTVYKQVLRDFTIPRLVCDRIYSSRYATHFYEESEIKEFVQKWAKS